VRVRVRVRVCVCVCVCEGNWAGAESNVERSGESEREVHG
jgi:hypothetical protein